MQIKVKYFTHLHLQTHFWHSLLTSIKKKIPNYLIRENAIAFQTIFLLYRSQDVYEQVFSIFLCWTYLINLIYKFCRKTILKYFNFVCVYKKIKLFTRRTLIWKQTHLKWIFIEFFGWFLNLFIKLNQQKAIFYCGKKK